VDASLADATTISVLLPLLIYQTYMYVYTPVESQQPALARQDYLGGGALKTVKKRVAFLHCQHFSGLLQ